MANPEVTVAALPQGVRKGINYVDAATATLVLQAPNKEFVYVIGDFNDWEPKLDYFMNQSPDGEYWWVTLENLTPRDIYLFQYLVDGELRIPDPYAETFYDPAYDDEIGVDLFPDLQTYPPEATRGIAAYLQTAQPEFEWTATDYERPDPENLVIYELLVRDFVEEHNYQTLIDTLGYFKRLGITAIELMPINEFDGNSSWGYNPAFYFAPDKYYGGKTDLKRFIDACHQHGIAVILDMVLNHSSGNHSLAQLYWDTARNRPAPENPWYNPQTPEGQYDWGFVDFNHESEYTQAFVDSVNRYWLETFNVDGYRFDFTKGFTNRSGSGDAYDAGRVALLKRMADQIWAYDSTAYVILEHWGSNSEEKELADYGMMLWGNANYNYNEAAMGYNDDGKSNFSWASYQQRGWSEPRLVSFMESHDEERLMVKNLQYGNSSGVYNIKDLATALDRMELAGAFYFTFPGPKMIWQFGELGYDISIDFNGRVGEKPIRWNYYHEPDRFDLFATWAELVHLKTSMDIFRTRDYAMNVDGAVKSITLESDTLNVTIVGNFDIVPRGADFTFPRTGMWYDYFADDSLNIETASTRLELQPGEWMLLFDRAGLVTGVEEPETTQPFTTQLPQNRPNPFNSSTEIVFQLGSAGEVQLAIYNLLGQKVKTLRHGVLPARDHRVVWDGRDERGAVLPSGVYIYRLQTASRLMSRKLLHVQ